MIRLERIAVTVSSIACGLLLSNCGGSSGDGSAPVPTVPNPLYVRGIGNDANSGASPSNALRTISRAAQIALDGSTIIVGPGTYPESVMVDRGPQGIAFFADTRGTTTGDNPGPIIVDARGVGPGFNLFNIGTTTVRNRTVKPIIDGFKVVGARDAGILIRGGSDFVVQSCVIEGTDPGDGIRVQDSANALVFNNLVYDSSARGIIVGQGAVGVRVLNNTVVFNGAVAVTIGELNRASPSPTIRNNIIQDNGGDAGIRIFPGSEQGYSGGFNLVLPDIYDPPSIRRAQDIHQDAQFVDPTSNDFYLQATSPAINRGASLIDVTTIDTSLVINGIPCLVRNDAACERDGTAYLNNRTATGGNSCDRGAPDMGFHTLPIDRCTAG